MIAIHAKTAKPLIAVWNATTSPHSAKEVYPLLTIYSAYAHTATDEFIAPGGSMPIPRHTPKELHPALAQLSKLTDLIAYQDFLGRKTRYGKRPGPEPWFFTRQYVAENMPHVAPEEVIQLFTEAGADNDVEAAFHVANNLHLLP